MTTNPTSLYEAYSLLMADLLSSRPHIIRFDANEEDWRERTEHLVKISKALDKYFLELGKDMAQHAHCSFDLKYFRGPLADAFDDMVGQMERAMEAAREHETLAAE